MPPADEDWPSEPIETPTDEDWRRAIDLFLALRMLGSLASRRRVEKLAQALEREALDVFRVARKLEGGLLLVLDLKERAVTHGRAAIVARLRDFPGRYVELAGLDTLDDRIGQGSASWYRQGGLLLDAAERVRGYVSAYQYIDLRRPEDEPGTVAWSYLIAQAARWNARDGEVARRLDAAGYVGADADVFDLKHSIQKHRLRRRPQKARKTRKRRSKRNIA